MKEDFLNFNTGRFGEYRVGEDRFFDRLSAERASALLNKPVSYSYFDSIWDSYPRDQIGKMSIDHHYLQRALQIRDKYDYLILMYSGGVDSHQILRTFIDNGIKLDELHVQWYSHWMDESKFTPIWNNSPNNLYSEWHLSIKPTLDWVREHHPEIKITVTDPLNSPTNIEKLITEVAVLGTQFIPMTRRYDEQNLFWGQRSKNTGVLFGVEKPILYRKDRELFFLFSDAVFAAATGHRTPETATIECFYTQIDMPSLPVEMAYRIAEHARKHPEFMRMIPHKDDAGYTDREAKNKIYHRLTASILYPNSYTPAKLAVAKSDNDCSDWFEDIMKDSHFNNMKKRYISELEERYSEVNQTSLVRKNDSVIFKPLPTKLFKLMDL